MRHEKILCPVILMLGFLASVQDSQAAVTPVARFDVVPYQRIPYSGSFKVGVVAFSKPGIEKVEFSAAGQGYSGGTKTVTDMSLNDRTDVWEYWVAFSAGEFTGNGNITISARVTDNEGNTRDLSLSMIVEGESSFVPVTAWVSPTGDDDACEADNESNPCASVAGAISAIQAAGGGTSDGAVIYLEEGTYSVSGASASTTNEWLTITKSDSASRDNVVIDSGRLSTGYLKYDSVTLLSRGSGLYVATDSSTHLWTNNTRRIGSGRWVTASNPVHVSDENNHFSTNDYTYDVDYAYRRAALVRGADISTVGNDVFENTQLVIRSTVDDISNGPHPSWHSDAYQVFSTDPVSSPPANNRIIYNYKATNVHYQGVFMRSDAGTATDNAFVNVFIEMREPPDMNETDNYSFGALSANHSWDHLIIWNSTFLLGHSTGYGTYTDVSYVGNIFYQFLSQASELGDPTLPYAEPGNTGGNEFLHNHFMYVYDETESCDRTTVDVFQEAPCPRWYAKRPDSGSPATYSTGGHVVDQDYLSESFTYPVEDSVIIDRISSPRVPVDLYNRERGSVSDLGAVEHAGPAGPEEDDVPPEVADGTSDAPDMPADLDVPDVTGDDSDWTTDSGTDEPQGPAASGNCGCLMAT